MERRSCVAQSCSLGCSDGGVMNDLLGRTPKIIGDVEETPLVIKEPPLAFVDIQFFPHDHDPIGRREHFTGWYENSRR